jgi:hypothetical protein
MLGRQQWLILLVEKDQQVLQLGKTITIAKSIQILILYISEFAALSFFITPMFTIFVHFLPPRKN